MADHDARQPIQSAVHMKSERFSSARKCRSYSPIGAAPTRAILLSGSLIFLLICSGCASSKQARASQTSQAPAETVATDQSSVSDAIRDCLNATEPVADSLRAGYSESALKAQETCREAMIQLNADGQGTQLGTRKNAAIGFISDMNSAVASAIISAGGNALSAQDTDRLKAAYRSSARSIERVLDPNYPFVGMSE